MIGLYLHPPAGAVVLCVDEKSQVQALERTQPMLPVRPGLAARRTHDYKRHGTTTLFAALEVATGKVTDACRPHHRHQEFLTFLKQVAKEYPRVPLHIVCDNYSAHKHEAVDKWLARNKRITLHFTPTSASWLNLVEVFFSIISRQATTAAASHRCPTSSSRSAPSSTPGTTAATRSSGPKTPTRSSPTANPGRLWLRRTSYS